MDLMLNKIGVYGLYSKVVPETVKVVPETVKVVPETVKVVPGHLGHRGRGLSMFLPKHYYI